MNKLYLKRFNYLKLKSINLYESKQYVKSIKHAEKALDLVLISIGKNSQKAAALYNIIAGSYSSKYEYDKALENFYQSLSIFLKLESNYDLDIAIIYNNIAVCYTKKSKNFSGIDKTDLKSSIFFYKKSLKIFLKKFSSNKIHIANLYNNLSTAYIRAGQYKYALKYIKISFNIKRKFCGKNSIEFAQSLLNKAKYHYYIKEYDISIKLLYQSIKILKNNNSYKSYLPLRFKNLALIYFRLQKYKLADHYIKKAFSEYLFSKNSSLDELIKYNPNLELLELIKVKSDLYFLKFKSQKNSEKSLIVSYENIVLSISLIRSLRLSYFYNDSRNQLSIKVISIYEKAIEICIELFKIKKDEKYLNEAYEYSQISKALSLIENIRDFDAKNSAEIPAAILNKEKNIKKKISELEKLIYEENKMTNGSVSKLNDLRNKLYDLKQKFEALVIKLEKDFPDYYNMKYDAKTVSVNEIKEQIPKDTMIIEYFMGDNNIFAFVFTEKNCEIIQIKKSKSFEKKIIEYRKLLTDPNLIFNQNSVEKLKKLSHYLYKILLKKILGAEIDRINKINNNNINTKKTNVPVKNILIVPDNELNFIPFDSLLTENHNETTGFMDLPYLIRYFNFIYNYSIMLYLKKLYEDNKNKNLSILAFAPEFNNHGIENDNSSSNSSNFRNSLSSLKYNQKEVRDLSKKFKGKFYFGKEAVKEKFIKYQNQYSVLHFATHCVMDNENPMYSKIVFSKSAKVNDSGFLHTFEIYSLSSRHDLVVLSACNTGYGKMIRGEGIMSVARAFVSSGSKNIVMTLWQVNDKSTSEIMKYFYRNIAKGERIGEALRNAKLKYLKNSDEIKAMPFYWSPFISFGVNDPINKV